MKSINNLSIILVLFLLVIPTVSLGQSKILPIPANGFAADAKKFAGGCESNWGKLASFAEEIYAAISEADFSNLDMDKFGPAYATAKQMERYGKALDLLREPCGVDYQLRGDHLESAINQVANTLLQSGVARNHKKNAERVFDSHTTKRRREIERILKLVRKKELSQAEADLDKLLYDVDTYVVWLGVNRRKQISEELRELVRQLVPPIDRIRKAQGRKSLETALASQRSNVDAVIEAAESAVESIGSTGRASLGGKDLSGPETIKMLAEGWQKSNASMIRAMSLSAMLGGIHESVPMQEFVGLKLGKSSISDALPALKAKMAELLPQIIAADLKRSGSTDDQGLLTDYLSSLAQVQTTLPPGVFQLCASELEAFESGSSPLATSIKNYKKATNDLLLWRKRISKAQVEAAGEYHSMSSIVAGLEQSYGVPKIREGLDKAIPKLREMVMDKNFIVSNVASISPKAGYTPYSERSWAAVSGEWDVTAEASSLEQDLFVSESNPPLSLAAATAVTSARRNEFAEVGGAVKSLQVEALGTRFPKLPPVMNGLVPLGEVPDMGNMLETDQSLLRVNVAPDWVRHEYFFKKL